MKKVNYTIREGNVIASWTEIPFRKDLPWIEVEDPESIHIGFDTVEAGKLVRHTDEYLIWKEAQAIRIAKLNRIGELKKLLAGTDYQAIKHSEGLISEEDYAPIKAQRQLWRDEINELEGE